MILKNYFFIKILAIYLLFFLPLKNLHSQSLDSNFYNWEVYEIIDEENEFKKCYMVNYPSKSDTNDTSRKKPFLMITRFQNTRTEEVSLFGGFDYKISSHLLMLVDSFQFRLKTKSDFAWPISKYEDIKIIETLLRGGIVKVRSDSAVGTFAVDEYNLKGIAKAYRRMREICR
jgi:hypothetical protein